MSWRLFTATTLLITGVAFTGDPDVFWRITGGLCLAVVPALIADHVILAIRPSRLDMLIQWADDHPPKGVQNDPDDPSPPPGTERGSRSPNG